MNNHYHTLGYLQVGENLGPLMQHLHGSVAKLVNDTLVGSSRPLLRRAGNQDYFDGCIRDVLQLRRAYVYTLLQAVRSGFVRDNCDYPHTRVNVELERAVARAVELNAFLEDVPYARYDRHRRERQPSSLKRPRHAYGSRPSMPNSFPGFPKQALTFFRQLARNNKREWFQAHKAQYDEHVHAPALELCALVIDDLRGFAADHACEPKRSLFRIYRDTRFSKDKTPYKTHIAAMFPRRDGQDHVAPASTSPSRKRASRSPPACTCPARRNSPPSVRRSPPITGRPFASSSLRPQLRSTAGELLGTKLARVPKAFDPDHPAADLLRMKQCYFDVTLPASAALEPSIRKQITTRFRATTPVVDYLNNAALAARKDADAAEADAIPKRPKPMF